MFPLPIVWCGYSIFVFNKIVNYKYFNYMYFKNIYMHNHAFTSML